MGAREQPVAVSEMSAVSVSEIHRYPPKPEGIAEPLWMTPEWKRSVLGHLVASPWLVRASEIKRYSGGGQSARVAYEPVKILVRDNEAFVVRSAYSSSARSHRQRSWSKRRVVEVLDLWREIRSWWDNEDAVDRLIVKVLLSGGEVVDLAKYRPDGWSLVGVTD